MSAMPLNLDWVTRPGGVCARRSAMMSDAYNATPAADTVFMNCLRELLIEIPIP
jgi:hypothetical protein